MRSERTLVRPVTVDVAEALLGSEAEFRLRFGLDVAEGYLAFPEALPATLEALRSGMPPEWFSYLIIDPVGSAVVGMGGFTGPPDDGIVEIGYSVAPAHRGRGHATDAARLWLDHAARSGVSLVRAHTLPVHSASTSVLEKLGFELVARLDDPETGAVWRWERPATPGAPLRGSSSSSPTHAA